MLTDDSFNLSLHFIVSLSVCCVQVSLFNPAYSSHIPINGMLLLYCSGTHLEQSATREPKFGLLTFR